MSSVTIQVSNGGRIVIPADIRKKMGINTGDQVLLSWSEEAQELRIATRKQRLRLARDLVKRYVKADEPVVDNFIKERHEAALDE